MEPQAPSALTTRWTPLRYHPTQAAYWRSPHRFNTVPAGRRSGKTEQAKRKLIRCALRGTAFDKPRFFAGAPTRDQAKRIFWDDLKEMVPQDLLAGRPSESELAIRLVNGSEIIVLGLDKPERVEGQPWDGGVLDEFANMKAHAWAANVRPALSDRGGWCDLIGVPEGRNHYYDLDRAARAEMLEKGAASEWGAFTWKSAEILPAAEIASARRDLDPLTYAQEYEASFVNFEGQAYYGFSATTHCARLEYNPRGTLAICLDFNVDPGIAVVVQEQILPNGILGTGVIGEVYIPRNSNTPAVCRKLAADWSGHQGAVLVYGDASGGARGTAQTQGSDWAIVDSALGQVFPGRYRRKTPPANPAERARLNAMNTRLRAGDETIRLMVDPSRAPHVVKDLEGVRLLKGGSGEIDKKADAMLTHLSDALGYYVEREFPIVVRKLTTVPVKGGY